LQNVTLHQDITNSDYRMTVC